MYFRIVLAYVLPAQTCWAKLQFHELKNCLRADGICWGREKERGMRCDAWWGSLVFSGSTLRCIHALLAALDGWTSSAQQLLLLGIIATSIMVTRQRASDYLTKSMRILSGWEGCWEAENVMVLWRGEIGRWKRGALEIVEEAREGV